MRPMGAAVQSLALVVGPTLVVAVSLLTFAGEPLLNTDDAFIVLVYARHLLVGQGLVWNQVPVEGFTSPLDLILKAGGMTLHDDPLVATFLLALVAHVACALIVFAIAFKLHLDAGGKRMHAVGWATLAALALASNEALAFGAAFLLETPLLVLIALSMVLAASTQSRLSSLSLGMLGALLVLVRPEGLPIALAAVVALRVREGGGWSGLLGWFPTLAVAVTALASSLLRRWYFEQWFPNSYYAKSSDSRWLELQDGAWYVIAGSDSLVGILLVVIAALGWFFCRRATWVSLASERAAHLAGTMAVLALLTTVLAGGDSYDGGRFLALPFSLALVLLAGAAAGSRGLPRAFAINALVAVTLVQLVGVSHRFDERLTRLSGWPLSLGHHACDRRFAEWLAHHAADLAVAQSDFQRLKFFADALEVIDLRGLNDSAIAHRVWPEHNRWGKYTPALGVEVNAPIWIWGRLHTPEPMASYTMDELLGNAERLVYFSGWPEQETLAGTTVGEGLRRAYVPASLEICGEQRNFFVHRNLADRFSAAGASVASLGN